MGVQLYTSSDREIIIIGKKSTRESLPVCVYDEGPWRHDAWVFCLTQQRCHLIGNISKNVEPPVS